LTRGNSHLGRIAPKANSAFVAAMEDMLAAPPATSAERAVVILGYEIARSVPSARKKR
jgi:hypothetical protein